MPPSVRILTRLSGDVSTPIRIEYVITDANSDLCRIDAEVSTNGGLSYVAATDAQSFGSEGKINLTSSPTGITHVFVWDPGKDFRPPYAVDDYFAKGVLFRISVYDTAGPGNVDVIGPLEVLRGVRIVTPAPSRFAPVSSAIWGAPVPIQYLLFDEASPTEDITVTYSTDNGVTWRGASEAQNVGSEGTQGLSAIPHRQVGQLHFFAWDAHADLPGTVTAGLLIAIATARLGYDRSKSVTIDQSIIGATAIGGPRPPPPPGWVPGFAEIDNFSAQDNIGPQVPIRFSVFDENCGRADLEVTVTGAGGAGLATPGLMSDSLDDVAIPWAWTSYRFIWDAKADNASGTVQLRITPKRDGMQAGPARSGQVVVNTVLPPDATVKPYQAPAPTPVLSLSIRAGNNQHGILRPALPTGSRGHLLPEPLLVQVMSNGVPMANVGIVFSIPPPTTPPPAGTPPRIVFEPDLTYWTTTDASGIAGIRVRTFAGAPGPAQVRAQVVGVPVQTVLFAMTLHAPKLEVTAPTGPLRSNSMGYVDIHYTADGTTVPALLGEILQPIWLDVVGTDCTVSHKRVRLPDQFGALGTTVRMLPTIRFGTAKVRFIDPLNPALSVEATIPVQSLPNVTRKTSHSRIGTAPQQVTMFLEPVTPAAPAVGFPGLTLAGAFAVRLVDAAGVAYTQQVTGALYDCTGGASFSSLLVTYAASAGTLSRTAAVGTSQTLADVPIGDPVYFTPDGQGPWEITATSGGPIADPLAQPFFFTDTSTQPPTTTCEIERNISIYGFACQFFVQAPTDIRMVATAGPLLNQSLPIVARGIEARVTIGGISPSVAGTADEVTLRTVGADGVSMTPYAYNGNPVALSQRVALRVVGAELQSDPVTLTGDMRSQSTRPQLVVPFGWLRASGDTVDSAWPVFGRKVDKRLTQDHGSEQENWVGSTPFAGAEATVQVRTGEFVYAHCDLDFRSRPSIFTMKRTWRGHLYAENVLGPGWSLEHTDRLELSRRYGLRWIMGDGRVLELPNPYDPPPGQYIEIRTNSYLDDDTSAFEIEGPHKTVMHFNIDGTLRFVRDRVGNRVTCVHDDSGRLIKLTDAMKREVTLDYWQPGPGIIDEIVGKLRQVRDVAGRIYLYDYYDAYGQDGHKGWLRQVTFPAAPAWVNGANDPAYSRLESYTYEVDQNDRIYGDLIAVRDALGRDYIVNEYTDSIGSGVVLNQDHGGGVFTFDYTQPPKVIVTDPLTVPTEYEFENSPFADATVPTGVVAKTATGELVYTVERNSAGKLVRNLVGERGGGSSMVRVEDARFVYDDMSASRRSRGNLLTAIQHPVGSGEDRVTSYAYDSRFNFIVRSADVRANASGNSEAFATRFYYDAKGSVIAVRYPATENVAIYEATNSMRWNEKWHRSMPAEDFQYNDFGLIKRYTNTRGIVTEYRYHPESSPSGGTVPPEPDGGGYLGAMEVDIADTPVRRDHVLAAGGGVAPLDPHLTRWAYNATGDVVTKTDAVGVTTTFQVDALRQVTQKTEADRTAGGLPALRIITDTFYDPSGNRVRSELRQPNAGPRAGGPVLIEEWAVDQWGAIVSTRHTLEAGSFAEQQFGRNEVGEVNSFQSLDATAGNGHAKAAVSIARDPRGLPTVVSQGATPGGAATGTMSWASNGQMESFTNGAQDAQKFHTDSYGDQNGMVDLDNSIKRTGVDLDGTPGRSLTQQGSANPTGAFPSPGTPVAAEPAQYDETVYDEEGRLRRTHQAVFWPEGAAATLSGAPATATPMKRANEYFPQIADLPPPTVRKLPDGRWGNGDGRITSDLVYDDEHLTRFVDDDGGVGYARLNAHGKPVLIRGSSRSTVAYVYDKLNRVTEVASLEQASTTHPPRTLKRKFEYDAVGRISRSIDGAGNADGCDYDESGHLTHEYDAMGPLSATETYNGAPVNQRGNETRYFRDGMGRILRVERPLSVGGIAGGTPDANMFNPTAVCTTEMEYDSAGRLFSFKDNAGFVTTWSYDDDTGKPTGNAHDLSTATGTTYVWSKVTYDAAGRTDTVTDHNGTRLKYGYDSFGRTVSIKAEVKAGGVIGSNEITFATVDHVNTVTDVTTGFATTIIRDSAGRPILTRHGAHTITCAFDGVGRRISMTYPSGARVTHEYDRTACVRRVLDNGAEAVAYNYLSSSRVQNRVMGNVQSRVSFVEGTLWSDGFTITGVGNWGTVSFQLERDREGRLTRRTRTGVGAQLEQRWSYDSVGRIVREEISRGGFTPQVTQRLYDGDGVIRREIRTSTAGVVTQFDQNREERGRIVSRNGVALRYDVNGNLIDDGLQQYAYDAWNRLVRVTRGGAALATYEYDGMHRRVARIDAQGAREDYVYDGWHLIEVRRAGQLVERYVYSDGLDDVVLLYLGATRFRAIYWPDGSLMALINDQNNAVEEYQYSLTGEPTVTVWAGTGTGAPRSRLLFQRRYYDALTGLYDYRTRWYHPRLGQFMTPDPAGFRNGANTYALCSNDPINRHDPFGMEGEETPGAGKRTPAVQQDSVAWAAVSGFGEGLVIGARALANVFTGGVFEEKLTPSDPGDRRLFHMAEVPATVSREALVLAATLGAGAAAQGSRLTQWGLKAARYSDRVGDISGRIGDAKMAMELLGEGYEMVGMSDAMQIAAAVIEYKNAKRRMKTAHIIPRAPEQGVLFNSIQGEPDEDILANLYSGFVAIHCRAKGYRAKLARLLPSGHSPDNDADHVLPKAVAKFLEFGKVPMQWAAKKINRSWGGGLDKYALEKVKGLQDKALAMYGNVMSKRKRFLDFARALIGIHSGGKQLSSEFAKHKSDPGKAVDVVKYLGGFAKDGL
jgi:RHS repeat-associated protein